MSILPESPAVSLRRTICPELLRYICPCSAATPLVVSHRVPLCAHVLRGSSVCPTLVQTRVQLQGSNTHTYMYIAISISVCV